MRFEPPAVALRAFDRTRGFGRYPLAGRRGFAPVKCGAAVERKALTARDGATEQP